MLRRRLLAQHSPTGIAVSHWNWGAGTNLRVKTALVGCARTAVVRFSLTSWFLQRFDNIPTECEYTPVDLDNREFLHQDCANPPLCTYRCRKVVLCGSFDMMQCFPNYAEIDGAPNPYVSYDTRVTGTDAGALLDVRLCATAHFHAHLCLCAPRTSVAPT